LGSWEVETVKRLACRLGRHDWTTRVEEGESYKVCAACGKSSREPAYSRSEGQQGRLREGDKGMDDIGAGGPTGGGP
jgi:hypothetical protein